MNKLKVNPMLKKEILVSVRSIKLTVLMLIFNIILAAIGLLIFSSVLETVRWSGRLDYSSTVSLYITLLVIEFILLAFIVPAITAGTISGERERQTLDILLSTSLSPSRIISGKLMSSIISVILLIISSMPVISLIFIFGGVSGGDILTSVLFLIFITVYAGAIGIACSARFKKTTTATVAAYGSVLFLGIGTLFLVGILCVTASIRYPYESNIGLFSLILLLNPAVSLMNLILKQVGSASDFSSGLQEIGVPGFMSDHWLIISTIVQILFILLLLIWSVKRLNPVKKKGRGNH